ncbi:hypothetical protein D3C86_1749820 [compost metagenome]
MLYRRLERHRTLALKPQGTDGGQQVQGRRRQGTAAHAKGRDQHECGKQGASDGPGSVRRIELTAGLAQLLRVGRQRAHQHRQGTAHQQRRNPD